MLSNKYFQNDQLCEEMNSRILPYDIVHSLQPFKLLQHVTTFSNYFFKSNMVLKRYSTLHMNGVSKCAISKHVHLTGNRLPAALDKTLI